MKLRASSIHRAGFTLVELMISISIALILLVGVNTVFQTTTATITAGAAISNVTRDARAAETTIASDFSNMLTGTDQPALEIFSATTFQFPSRSDKAADLDGNPQTVDVNDNATEGEAAVNGEVLSPVISNERLHRNDMLSFYISSLFRRQTGGGTKLVSDFTSREAWVSYSHCVSLGATNFIAMPSSATDPLFYARKWILGRTVILFGAPADGYYVNQSAAAMSPIRADELANLQFDVANTSIATMRQNVLNDPTNWFNNLTPFRFVCNATPSIPLTPTGAAQTLPQFLSGCTQFIVEYAGDFIGQDPSGSPFPSQNYYNATTGLTQNTDGETDFVIVPFGATSRKVIRWYGFPRDTDGDGAVRWNTGDVVPLRDLWVVTAPTETNGAPFERAINTGGIVAPPVNHTATAPPYESTNPPGTASNEAYYCAWGPSDRKPTMIRITIRLDDANGRLPDGRTFEYIFKLPGN